MPIQGSANRCLEGDCGNRRECSGGGSSEGHLGRTRAFCARMRWRRDPESAATQLSRCFGDGCGGIGWVLRQEGSYLLLLLLVATWKRDEVFLLVLLSLTARHDGNELEKVSIGKNRGGLGRKRGGSDGSEMGGGWGMERGRKGGRL